MYQILNLKRFKRIYKKIINCLLVREKKNGRLNVAICNYLTPYSSHLLAKMRNIFKQNTVAPPYKENKKEFVQRCTVKFKSKYSFLTKPQIKAKVNAAWKKHHTKGFFFLFSFSLIPKIKPALLD